MAFGVRHPLISEAARWRMEVEAVAVPDSSVAVVLNRKTLRTGADYFDQGDRRRGHVFERQAHPEATAARRANSVVGCTVDHSLVAAAIETAAAAVAAAEACLSH